MAKPKNYRHYYKFWADAEDYIRTKPIKNETLTFKMFYLPQDKRKINIGDFFFKNLTLTINSQNELTVDHTTVEVLRYFTTIRATNHSNDHMRESVQYTTVYEPIGSYKTTGSRELGMCELTQVPLDILNRLTMKIREIENDLISKFINNLMTFDSRLNHYYVGLNQHISIIKEKMTAIILNGGKPSAQSEYRYMLGQCEVAKDEIDIILDECVEKTYKGGLTYTKTDHYASTAPVEVESPFAALLKLKK